MVCFLCLGPRLLLPSIFAFLSARDLWAAKAFHRAASVSRKGKSSTLLASWVIWPIHFARALTAMNSCFHLLTSSGGTRWCSAPLFASLSAVSLARTSCSPTSEPSLLVAASCVSSFTVK